MNKIKSLIWYARNPNYYFELIKQVVNLVRNKFRDKLNDEKALLYCQEKSMTSDEAILKLFPGKELLILGNTFSKELIEAKKVSQRCPIKMGGGANLNLLYTICEYCKPKVVVETGVAYGWSSLAILLSSKNNELLKLYSIDKPYPWLSNEGFVGCVVPEKLKSNWKLFRLPDSKGLKRLIDLKVNLCHYDSDKSYFGRMKNYPILWKMLSKEGIFVSDDIGDNSAFLDFCQKIKQDPIIVRFDGKFVGILRKN